MNASDGEYESHALTILRTMHSFADVARVLADRSVPARATGLVARVSTLRSGIDPEECEGQPCAAVAGAHNASCLIPAAVTMETLELAPGGAPLAMSRGHVSDRLTAAKTAGATGLSEALGGLMAARDATAFDDAVARGEVLIWMVTTNAETASVIASILLAHSAYRVCTFTKPRFNGADG